MNEELKIQAEALNSMEEAYQLACTNGYTGTRKEFGALCAQAAEATTKEEMDLDDMDQVAGGASIGEMADSVGTWVKENPALTVGIVGSVITMGAAVAYGAYKYKQSLGSSGFSVDIGQYARDLRAITGETSIFFD